MGSRLRFSRFAPVGLIFLTIVLAVRIVDSGTRVLLRALTEDQSSQHVFARANEPPGCPGERFTDVCPGDYFYAPVLYLNNWGIVSGYYSSPPCTDAQNTPCFRPYTTLSRGQIAKIVSLVAGFNEPVSGQSFEDVPPGSTFYEYIERMASRGIMYGYFAAPPCSHWTLPCFFPNNSATRGQMAKVLSRAFNFTEPVSGQRFEDVPPDNVFYEYIERLTARGMLTGYPCGEPNEPCKPPDNKPYFRPAANVMRGQAAKITYDALFQPPPTSTPVWTATPTATPIVPCCQGVMGVISSYCTAVQQGNWIDVTITLTNTCSLTVRAEGMEYYEIAPSPNGPWWATHMSYYGNLIPPLPDYVTGTHSFGVGQLPAGYYWWREHLQLSGIDPYSCWTLDLATPAQPECVQGTPTTTITSNRANLPEYSILNALFHR